MQSLVTGNAWADATTSANLSQFTSGAALSTDNGTTWDSDSSWTVKPGQNYQVKVSFAEREDAQFDMNRDLSYKLPTGFNPNGNSANVDITVQYTDTDGTNKSVTIAGNSFVVGNDGNVTFKWNKNDPNFQKLAEANNVQFDLTFGGQFSSDVTRLDFGHSITKDVTVDTSHDVNVQKEGSYNQTDGKVHYKVTVTSTGTNENVVVTDAITGTALTYDNNVQATSDSTATGTAAKKDNGFTYTIPNMTDGQKVVLEYTASVDFDSLTGKGTVQQTGNGVTVKIDGKDKPGETTTNLENRIDYSGLTKAAGEATGDGNVKTVPWTVTYNEKATASMAGRTITDSIGAASQDIMKYKGDVTVTVKDASGKVVRTDTIKEPTGTSYTYQVPEGDRDPYVYVFTYNTTVDMTGKVTDARVTNEAHDDHGQSSTGTTDVGPGTPADLKKTATKVTVDKISWTTSFNVPKAGLTKAEVTDTLPGMYIDKWYYDELDADSLVVRDSNDNTYTKDATSGQGYTLTTGTSEKGEPTFTVSFYYYNEKGERVEGISAADAEHTISVSYDTKNNADWMAKYDESIADYQKVHTNKVSANLNGTVLTTEAKATPRTDKNKVTKVAGNNGQPVGYQTLSDGTKLPVWKFTLQLKGEPTADMQVTDEFNTSLFAVVDAQSLKDVNPLNITGIDNIHTTNTFGTEYDGTYDNYVAMSQANSGVTFTVSQTNIDKARKKDKPENQQYTGDNFRITYYLVAKDANALKTLNQQAATEAKTFTNTAKWDSSESAQNFTYQYKPISKTATDLLADVAGTNYKNVIKYTLVINPDAQQVGTGDTLTATDTISNNLAFIYDSIQVTPSEGVTYDASGSTLTFKVPNATKVTVTYYAKVIKTGTFDVTNTATVNGQSEKVTKNVTLNASGSGTASIPSIKIFKYKSGDMGTALAGAKFALFDNEDAANRAVTNPTDLDATHFCGVYTTNAKGLVLIDAYTNKDGEKNSSQRLWKDKQYYLVELEAPTGYEKTTTVFKFKLADQPDYDNFVYYLGDEMKVSNKEQQTGSLEITKTTTGGTTPAEATFTITGPNNYSKTVKYSEFTDGKYTIDNLPVGDYTVTESGAEVTGYTLTVTGSGSKATVSKGGKATATIKNSYKRILTSVSVAKSWVNADGSKTWPKDVTVTVTLLANGEATDKTATLSADKTNATFDNLVKFDDDGKEINYTVQETAITGASKNAYTIASVTANGKTTITNTEKTTQVKVTKGWTKADGSTSWPKDTTVTVALMNGETQVATHELTADSSSYTFTNLPEYDKAGNKIAYTVKEISATGISLTGYTATTTGSAAEGYTVTNTQKTTQVKVAKEWTNADGSKTWPEGVTVTMTLLANGEATDKTATLSADKTTATFESLPEYDADGEKIAYTVEETAISGASVKAYTVTSETADGAIVFTNAEKTTQVQVTKAWANADGTETWPVGATVTVALMNGETQVATHELSADETSFTFENLPEYDAEGNEIAYTVKEISATGVSLTGYTTDTAGDMADGFTITNTQIATQLSVSKVWQKADGSKANWPKGVTVTVELYANGEATGQTLQLTADEQDATFTGLAKYDADGKETVYTVKETKVEGVDAALYETFYEVGEDGTQVIVNKAKPTEEHHDKKKEKKGALAQTGDPMLPMETSALIATCGVAAIYAGARRKKRDEQ